MYGYSTLICLPDGLSSTPSEDTGTVMRRSILTDYATRARFRSVEVLPIEDFAFFRFYRRCTDRAVDQDDAGRPRRLSSGVQAQPSLSGG